MSSGRSFIERLKERQRSKDQSKRRHSAKEVELPNDLVESFDIEQSKNETVEDSTGNWLDGEEQSRFFGLEVEILCNGSKIFMVRDLMK
jgi:hypothetical protein